MSLYPRDSYIKRHKPIKKHRLSEAIGLALVAGTIMTSVVSVLSASDCSGDSCDDSPYTLTITSHGEGVPRADNRQQDGRRENRRVDVSVSVEIPQKPEPQVAAARRVEDAGTFWISRDPGSLDRLLELGAPTTVSIESGKLHAPVKFSMKTNYPAFIERWEVIIESSDTAIDAKPVQILTANKPQLSNVVEWDGSGLANAGFSPMVQGGFEHGQEFVASLRVYDSAGNFDETPKKTFRLVETQREEQQGPVVTAAGKLTIESLNDENIEGYSEFASQSIPIAGAKVRIHGLDISKAQQISVNGEKIKYSNKERFLVEYLMPEGDHQYTVSVKSKSGKVTDTQLAVSIDDHYFFMIGLADLTIGENAVSGSIDQLGVDEHHYGGDLFVDGRLAFYLKGKIKGKYLVTAQMDSGVDDIKNLFDDLHRKDTTSLFRRLDPDQYYLVYGDDSTITDDTDSQGKLYVRVDWDKSQALWGNFNTSFTGTELAPFNRSLYGGRVFHRSLANTELGDARSEITAFASEAQTAFRHNEFIGTGGSLYYLRDKDIVRGSEKVWVEVRRDGSEQLVQRLPLESGRDYDIDEFQGRLILNRPLLSVSSQSGPSIIRDEPLDGDNTYLVVDYEYIPSEFVSGNATSGVRAKHWFSNHIAVGGTWVKDNRDADDYQVKAVDVTLKHSDNSYLRFEFADSEFSQTSGSFTSTDGGLTFTPFNSNAGVSSGRAAGVEARMSVNEFYKLNRSFSVGAWAKRRDAGFSIASVDTGADTTDLGIEAIAQINADTTISTSATSLEKKNQSRESAVAVEVDYRYTDRTALTVAYRHVDDENISTSTRGSGDLMAGKVSYDFSDKLNGYVIGQYTLAKSGTYQSNNLYTLGTIYETSKNLKLNGEISSGDKGESLLFGADWRLTDTYSLYSNFSTAFGNGSDNVDNTLTVGQRKTVSNSLKVYSEHQFKREGSRGGQSHTFGLDHKFNRYTNGSLSLQLATLEDDVGNEIDREAISASFDYQRDKSRWGTRLEYRHDQGLNLDVDQWVATNRAEYRHSPSMRWQGKLNTSITNDRRASSEDAEFVEAGIGFAYRPVQNDRLNILGRMTYLYDLPPLSQSASTDERSLIYSFESLYELAEYVTVGGKVARRSGEIRTDRGTGQWSGNDASLLALRLGYRVPFGVDSMLSYRWLTSENADTTSQGALFSIGKSVGDNLQLSVGYNFTSFDDNLAGDDYDVGGWFLNLVGKY